jgi:D-alanine transfer protein
MAVGEMIFGTALDFELKRDIASRMLQHRITLKKKPLLEFELRRLASGHWLDRIIFCALWPAGKVQTSLLELQDHVAALNYIRHRVKPALPRHSEALDWPRLIAKVNETEPINDDNAINAANFDTQIVPGSRDAAFRNDLNASPGWADLQLLLRELAKVRARALILSMPIPGDLYDHLGISRSAREDYYSKLRVLVSQYHFPVVEFEAHDSDSAFLIRHQSHLTAKGWMYYDRALDDFFHRRIPRS